MYVLYTEEYGESVAQKVNTYATPKFKSTF